MQSVIPECTRERKIIIHAYKDVTLFPIGPDFFMVRLKFIGRTPGQGHLFLLSLILFSACARIVHLRCSCLVTTVHCVDNDHDWVAQG